MADHENPGAVSTGRVTTERLLAIREELSAHVDAWFPENSRLKAVAKTEFDKGFGALLLLRAE